MAKSRVGDQTTGRAMDTLKDEKERGITIKSAAITLGFRVKASLLQKNETNGSKKPQEEKSQGQEPKTFYVGKLPSGLFVSRNDFVSFLVDQGLAASTEEAERDLKHWNGHRGFALVATKDSQALLSSLQGLSMEGCPPVEVEEAGADSMTRLNAVCKISRIDMPAIKALSKTEKGKYSGVANWPSLGGAIVQSASEYSTKRKARHAVAEECLRFLHTIENEPHDFAGQPEDSFVPSSETIKKPEESKTTVSHQLDNDKMEPLVMNLIDSPGHIEFNAEVTAALRVSDGALVVVDAVEGKSVQTDNVLRQALKEGVVPVLMINKVDRLFLDKQLSPKEVFDCLQSVIDSVNGFITAHQLPQFPDLCVNLEAGNVCFGSGYFGWSCTIDSFLPLYYAKESAFSNDIQATRCSLAKRENFIKHILRPLVKMHRACGVLPSLTGEEMQMPDRVKKVEEILSKLSVRTRLLQNDDDPSVIPPRKLLKKAMMAWLPSADALLDMITYHLPSPATAQVLRAPLLYSGDMGDPCGRGIRRCDPNASVVVYVSKMSPCPVSKRLIAFGRIFSGTLHPGDTLRALRTDGGESEAKVSKILVCGIRGRMQHLDSAEAGQLVALEGVDGALKKAGTLTNSVTGKAIRHMNMAVEPVFQRGIRPRNKTNMTKMVSSLQRITNSDSTALFFFDKETEQYILAASGELHVEVLVSSLLQDTGIEVDLSEPIVAFNEGIRESSGVALAKSVNKHNRIFIKATPLAEDIVAALSSGKLNGLDHKALQKGLVSEYGWDSATAARIWVLGPHGKLGDSNMPTCMLVDSTFGLQIPQDARENILAAFQQVVESGVLVHAPMRGVRFDLLDAKFHQDTIHRRPNSVVPAASRAMRGAFVMAKPCLLEPIYRVEINGEPGSLNGVYAIIGQRSGTIVDTGATIHSENIRAVMPIRCSFGMVDALRLASKGQSHCTCVYEGMALVPLSETTSIVLETRKKKALPEEMPCADSFIDKL